jgi:hypothetical protein
VTHPEHYRYAEHVLRLSSDLRVVAANYPGLTGSDVDFGSTPVLFDGPPNCGPMLAIEAKSGDLFLYRRDDIAAGPADRAKVSGDVLVGVPAYSPRTRMLYVGTPVDSPDGVYQHGLLAFTVSVTCKLSLAWHATVGSSLEQILATPSVAGGIAFFGGGHGRVLHAFDALLGNQLWNSGSAIDALITTEPVVVNGMIYQTATDRLFALGP